MTRTKTAPYQTGDQINILRSDTGGTVWGPLTVERVVPMTDGQTWRICSTRSNGTPIEVYVGRNGRDPHGYVEPVSA